MIRWRGPEGIVLEQLSRAGADRGDDGRFIVSGEPCQYTLRDAVLHVAVPVSAVFFVRGKRRSFATILEGVASINPLLDKASNHFGKLDAAQKQSVMDYIATPTEEGWSQICSMIISPGGMGHNTIWQWVVEVDPSFPRSRPSKGPWPRIPDPMTVARAIKAAAASRGAATNPKKLTKKQLRALPKPSPTIIDWTAAELVQATRYDGLGYQKQHTTWRFIDLETNAAIGGHYKTKRDLLREIDEFADTRGFNHHGGSAKNPEGRSANPDFDHDVDELLAMLTPAEMACLAKIHRGESVLTHQCGDLMWGLEPKGALWTRDQGRQEPWLTGPGKVVAMLADRWEKLPPQSRPLGPQTPGISGEQMTIATPSLKRLQQRIATALGWSLADVQSMSLPSLREVVGPVSQKLANDLTRHISAGAITRNPETDGWWVAGNRWLQKEALEEYRSQLRAHTKSGRKKSTMRYVVPVWQQEMVAALGRNDEEEFKSLRLHHMNLQWNEEHPLSKRRSTNPMATAQEMLDAIYAWLVKEKLTYGVSFVSPEKWRELGWDAELGLPEVTEGFVVVAEGTALNQALAGYMDHNRAEEKKIYDGWSKVIEAHGWGWQAKTVWSFHVYPSEARIHHDAVPQSTKPKKRARARS